VRPPVSHGLLSSSRPDLRRPVSTRCRQTKHGLMYAAMAGGRPGDVVMRGGVENRRSAWWPVLAATVGIKFPGNVGAVAGETRLVARSLLR